MSKNPSSTIPNTPFNHIADRLECELVERKLRSQAQWAAACAVGRFFKNTFIQARAVMIDAAELQKTLSKGQKNAV
jgi:hypothetical protein